MSPAILNALIGIAQPLIPSIVAYGLSAGWFSTSTLGMIGAVAAAIAATVHSAATTTAVGK